MNGITDIKVRRSYGKLHRKTGYHPDEMSCETLLCGNVKNYFFIKLLYRQHLFTAYKLYSF